MAIVVGPLFSQEARGQFGKSVVFRRRKGQNVVSSYVIPANPDTSNQRQVRDYIRVSAAIVRSVNLLTATPSQESMSAKDFLIALTTGALIWANVLTNYLLGGSNATIAADFTAYTGIGTSLQNQWQAAATASPFNLATISGTSGNSYTAGFQLWVLQKALRLRGYGSTWPGNTATPDSYT